MSSVRHTLVNGGKGMGLRMRESISTSTAMRGRLYVEGSTRSVVLRLLLLLLLERLGAVLVLVEVVEREL
jgi:hypothetical protein